MHQKLPSSTTSTTPQKTKVKMNLMVFSMDRISIWVLYFEAPSPPLFPRFLPIPDDLAYTTTTASSAVQCGGGDAVAARHATP